MDTVYGSLRDKMAARTIHGTPQLQVENAKVFELLNNAIGLHKHIKTWIKVFMTACNGQGTWLVFKAHYCGSSKVEAIEAAAEKVLESGHYTGKKPHYNFKTHVSKHQKAQLFNRLIKEIVIIKHLVLSTVVQGNNQSTIGYRYQYYHRYPLRKNIVHCTSSTTFCSYSIFGAIQILVTLQVSGTTFCTIWNTQYLYRYLPSLEVESEWITMYLYLLLLVLWYSSLSDYHLVIAQAFHGVVGFESSIVLPTMYCSTLLVTLCYHSLDCGVARSMRFTV
jgi:hypothetical protein